MPTKLISYEHLFNEDFLQFDETFCEQNREFKLHVYGKRQI